MLVAVELDPPARLSGPAALERMLGGAKELKDAGAGLITIADNPRALPRGDSACLAILLSRDAGIDAMPHLSCRDRNAAATLSTLLALDMAGLRQVLVVAGDPFPPGGSETGSRAFAGSVDFARKVSEWGNGPLSGPFALSAALNVNAANFGAELSKARRKAEAGVSRFLTQPILSQAAMDNLARAGQALDAPILGGVLPIVSERNAEFLSRGEIPGIVLDPELRRMYAGRGKEEAERIAVEASLAIMERMRPLVDGYYLVTPFSRTDIVAAILRSARHATPCLDRRPVLVQDHARREGVVIAERSTR